MPGCRKKTKQKQPFGMCVTTAKKQICKLYYRARICSPTFETELKTNALSEVNTFEMRLFVVKIVVRILFFVTVRHFYPDVSRRFCF